MPTVSIRIPQLGEGLREAYLVDFLKSPGDSVARDEPLFTMETDKAVSDVECPHAGTLVKWLVEVDSVLEIGTEIAIVDRRVLRALGERFRDPTVTPRNMSQRQFQLPAVKWAVRV